MHQSSPARAFPTGSTDHDTCHEEDGSLARSQEFDYEAIDRNVFRVEPKDDSDEFSAEEIDAACKVFTRLVEWIWQDGMKNVEGLQIRAIIVCWIFLSQLRPLTLTQMAAGFGKRKQSLGRWVDDFKRSFPRIRICHMKD